MSPAQQQRTCGANTDYDQRERLTKSEVNDGPSKVPEQRGHPFDRVGAIISNRNCVLLCSDVLEVVSPEKLTVDCEKKHEVDEEESSDPSGGHHCRVVYRTPMQKKDIEGDVEMQEGAQVNKEIENERKGVTESCAAGEDVVDEPQTKGDLEPKIGGREDEEEEVQNCNHRCEQTHGEMGLAEAEHDRCREDVTERAHDEKQGKENFVQLADSEGHVDGVVEARAGDGERVDGILCAFHGWRMADMRCRV